MAAHRHWRVLLHAAQGYSPPTYTHVALAELELRTSVGGTNVAPSGDGRASNSDAFKINDGLLNSSYAVNLDQVPAADIWAGVDFGAGTEEDIVEIVIHVESGWGANYAPSQFDIQYSDDADIFNATWTTTRTVTGVTDWVDTDSKAFLVSVPVVVSAQIENQIGLFLSAHFENQISTPSGYIFANLENRIVSPGFISANLENQIVSPGYFIQATLENEVFSSGFISATLENRIQSVSAALSYTGRVMLDGTDVSGRINGEVVVDMRGEGAARIAEFTLKPFIGSINPHDWVGVPVVIEYLGRDAVGSVVLTERLFTGVVQEPVYDVSSRNTAFLCTDGLQEYLEQKPFDQIASEVGGYHSSAVFGDTEDGWEYSQQRMSTQAASFDLDRYGLARKTDWAANPTADFVFSESSTIDGTLELSLARRRDILNQVALTFDYRYSRNWQRDISGVWVYPRSFGDYILDSTTLPKRSMVEGALGGNWLVKSIVYTKLPPSGAYSTANGLVAWGITEALRRSFVWGVNFAVSKRWRQNLTESYSITVNAPASIARHGLIDESSNYSLDGAGEDGWGDEVGDLGLDLEAGVNNDRLEGKAYASPPVTSTQISDSDYIEDAASSGAERADADNAAITAIALNKTKILASHRNNHVIFDCELDPTIDVDSTVAVQTGAIDVAGKVYAVRHVFNASDDIARTTVDVAFYQPDVSGQVDDSLAAPSPPDTTPATEVKSIHLDTHLGGRTTTEEDPTWTGWVGNWAVDHIAQAEIYTEAFRVTVPEVEAGARENAEFSADATVQVAIPQNPLTITA